MWRSLRFRIVVAILSVAIAPLAIVFSWSQVDRNVPGRKWTDVRDAMDAAAREARTADDKILAAKIAELAEDHNVRLRVFRDGTLRADTDADAPVDALHRVESFFFGSVSTESVREIDESFGPLDTRPEVMAAEKGTPFVGCEFRAMLFCQAVKVGRDAGGARLVVIAQASSHRAVAPVYLLRRQLLRIGLLTLPGAIVLAWYAGRIVVKPLARLRAQAIRQTQEATRGAALLHRHADEVGDLAASLNALLSALEKKREDDGRFAAELVHDLKNPVAAIRACAEQLAGGRAADPARAAKLAAVLEESAGRLDRVVTHFLELARAEAGMPNEERVAVDVGALARGLVASMQSDARCDALTLSCAIDDAEVLRVVGVEHRLEALLRELLENAISFAGAGGRVEVRVGRKGGVVELVVEDSGPGIRPEDLPRVFERFFTTRGRARGTGLGLALVKAVAEAHGGAVSAASEVGRGAAFTVRLPR